MSGNMSGLQNGQQQLKQALLFVRFHTDSEGGEVDTPTNPDRMARQTGFVPRHRHIENEQEQN